MPWVSDEEYARLLDIEDDARTLVSGALSTFSTEQDQAYERLCRAFEQQQEEEQDGG